MPDEPATMRQIHEIRECLYERRNSMSPQAYINEVNEVGRALATWLGLRVVPPWTPPRADDSEGNGAASSDQE